MKKSLFAFALLAASSTGALQAADLDTGIYQLNRGAFKKAIAEFTPLVEEGYAPAQYQMALVHINGWGVRKDAKAGYELLTKAAKQNYPDAQFELALMYAEGKIAKKDLRKAYQLTAAAAEEGLASAQFNLAVMYANGEGITRDYVKAAKWYEKAAEQNYALAQFNLALMYYEGKGVEKSSEKSYFWNWIAAKSGFKDAITSRDLDERNLSAKQIQEVREEADEKYRRIMQQRDLKAKKAAERAIN